VRRRSDAGNHIDRLVFGRLNRLGIQPANLCSDSVFVRRASLDVIGTLPSAREARDFVLDRDPAKRRVLIDHLLQRDEFADYWAMKWSDLLRSRRSSPSISGPTRRRRIIADSHRLQENNPTTVRREMLIATGSNVRVPEVNFYRALQSREPQAIAKAVALTFMGTRAENWPRERLSGMAAFFSQLGYKYTAEWRKRSSSSIPASSRQPAAAEVFPDGPPPGCPRQDPREAFAAC